jgi:hypothetical protein
VIPAVVLDFELDAGQIAELAAVDPATANPAVVDQSYLLMPVTFEVAGRSMLLLDPAPAVAAEGAGPASLGLHAASARLAILGFAISAISGIAEYERSGSGRIFVPEGDDIGISAGSAPGLVKVRGEARDSAEVDYESLRAAVLAFDAKVRRLMVEHLPALSSVAALRSWYRD